MSLRTIFHSLGFVLVFIRLSYAQSVLGLQYPIGIPLGNQSGMAAGMGSTACGVGQEQHLMLRNPGNLGSIDRTVFSSLLSFDFVRAGSGDAHSTQLTVVPKQISFGVPLGVAGTIAFSLQARSNAAVKFRIPLDVGVTPSFDTASFALSRNGGLRSWEAGWGRSIGKLAQIGVSYSRSYLGIDATHIHSISAVRDSGGTIQSHDSSAIMAGINGIKIGAMVPIRKKVRIGLAGEYFLSANATQSRILYTNFQSISDTAHKFTLQLPPSWVAGASYAISSEWLAATDVSAVLWSQYRSDGMLAAADVDAAPAINIGCQYIPAPELLSAHYWEVIRYRGGFRLSQLPAKGNIEWGLSLGAGLPLKAGGVFDVVLEYGWRTGKRYSNYAENTVGISFGISSGRKWTHSVANDSY